ncbi:hypothetical protein FGO68_gene7105 [Halteria grandinella]|uniref:MORN repeat protein n=1 Tax=Halteria grandinella TaxID=5974 RepID=A0A8J8NLX9_HALGN|nr:hypothetical protein FGO68_gene7105 [Halteria grandinella]
MKPAPYKPSSFTQSGLDRFLNQIRQRGHTKLVDFALLNGLTLFRLEDHALFEKEVKQLPFEGNEYLESGGIFFGECKNNNRNGYGLLYCTDYVYGAPQLYECEWGAAIKGGLLTIGDNTWEKYEGEFNQQYLRTGTGRWENQDGDTYIGEWKDDRQNGQGKYTYPGGVVYEGNWKDNMANGKGKCTWGDGSVYEGEWKDDSMHGQGKWTFTNGDYQIGTWENNNQIGEQVHYSKEGELLEYNTYEDGKLIKIVEVL